MKRTLARILSFIFNPLVILLPVPYLLLRRAGEPMEVIGFWTGVTWIFIFTLGIIMIFLVEKKVFSNLDVSIRQQRPLLFIIILVEALLYFFSLFLLKGPPELYAATLGIMFGLLLISFINLKVKASIHMAALVAFVLTIIVLRGWMFLWLLILLPIVAWSRLILKKHTKEEVIAGTVSGILLTTFLYILFKYVFLLGT